MDACYPPPRTGIDEGDGPRGVVRSGGGPHDGPGRRTGGSARASPSPHGCLASWRTDVSKHMALSVSVSVAGPDASAGVAIEVRGLRHAYLSPAGRLEILRSLDLDVPAGGYCTLRGPSGSGKSTLLALLGGLEHPQEGLVCVGGFDLAGLSGQALAAYRRSTVGFVFQDFGLLDTLSAGENVELAAALDRTPRAARRHRARGLLEAVGLAERTGHRPPQLSGGERQRVAMA